MSASAHDHKCNANASAMCYLDSRDCDPCDASVSSWPPHCQFQLPLLLCSASTQAVENFTHARSNNWEKKANPCDLAMPIDLTSRACSSFKLVPALSNESLLIGDMTKPMLGSDIM
eukprot:1351210-Amphidinium_carterae.2